MAALVGGCSCFPDEPHPPADADSDTDTDTASETETATETETETATESASDTDTTPICDEACEPDQECCADAGWWGGPACVNVLTNPAACGECGHACTDGRGCFDGECRCATDQCGDTCTDVLVDAANCGACGNACAAETPLCRDGTCVTCEGAGLTDCGGDCVDLPTNEEHCGACDAVCDGFVCSGGHCIVEAECDAECVDDLLCCVDTASFWFGESDGPGCTDPNWDWLNCGGCNVACGPFELCSSGTCTCLGIVCDGVCLDWSSDPANCGDCGIACADGDVCCEGLCQAADVECPPA